MLLLTLHGEPVPWYDVQQPTLDRCESRLETARHRAIAIGATIDHAACLPSRMKPAVDVERAELVG